MIRLISPRSPRYFLFLATTLLVAGCDNFDLYTLLDGRPPGDDGGGTTLALTVSAVSLGGGDSYAFSARGGVPPYTWTVTEGSGTIDTGTGVYTASTTPGMETVQVSDFVGATAEAAVTVLEPVVFSIAPASVTVAAGTVFTFTATGGLPPVVFAVTSGGGAVDPETGVYTAPASVGTAVVRATDTRGLETEATVTVVTDLDFTLSPTELVVYVNNTVAFTYVGGVAPVTFDMVSGGGTVVSATGIYHAPSEPGTDEVRGTDASGAVSTATVMVLDPFAFGPAGARTATNTAFVFVTTGGLAPYTYTVVSGSGTVDATGLYTAPGFADLAVVRAEDTIGNTLFAAMVVDTPTPLAITPPWTTVNVNDEFVFSATGGKPPYTFSVQLGTGLVNADVGTFTAPGGPESGVVRVTDSLLATSDSNVTVVNGGLLTLDPTPGFVVQGETLEFRSYGGTLVYTYSLQSGDGTVNATSGTYHAPEVLGNAVVRTTDTVPDTADSWVVILPRSPTGLVADGAAGAVDEIRLSWTDRSTGEDGFEVERRDGVAPFALVATLGPEVGTYLDTGLATETTYLYRVRAYHGVDYSDYSNEAFAVAHR